MFELKNIFSILIGLFFLLVYWGLGVDPYLPKKYLVLYFGFISLFCILINKILKNNLNAFKIMFPLFAWHIFALVAILLDLLLSNKARFSDYSIGMFYWGVFMFFIVATCIIDQKLYLRSKK